MRQRWSRPHDRVLESGEALRGCRLGYRVIGRLDASRSNAVLLLPWFMGRSIELLRHVGRGRLVETARHCVIIADALGAGVSTSPSHAPHASRARFPSYTVRDLVDAQCWLVREELGLSELHAVCGISFGGMQVFEWLVRHPALVKRAVSIAGSPRLSAAERARWLEDAERYANETRLERTLAALRLGRPLGILRALRDDPRDCALQAEALATTDVSASFGGSLERAAAEVRAPTLVVVSAHDEVVDPAPARAFARATSAHLLVLDGRAGHDAPARERATLWPAVRRFVADGLPPRATLPRPGRAR